MGLLASSTAYSFSVFISGLFGAPSRAFALAALGHHLLEGALAPIWHPASSLWPLSPSFLQASLRRRQSPLFFGPVRDSPYCIHSCIALVTLCYSYFCMDLTLPPERQLLEGVDYISLIIFNLIYTASAMGTVWEGEHVTQMVRYTQTPEHTVSAGSRDTGQAAGTAEDSPRVWTVPRRGNSPLESCNLFLPNASSSLSYACFVSSMKGVSVFLASVTSAQCVIVSCYALAWGLCSCLP